MAIITEYINHANTEIPFVNRDDLAHNINFNYPTIQNVIINGQTFPVKFIYDSAHSSNGLSEHVSNYIDPEVVDNYVTHYALKSKKGDKGYKYLTISTKRNSNNWYEYVFALSKTEKYNQSTDIAIATPALGSSVRPVYITIAEIGDYIGILRSIYDRSGSGVYGIYAYFVGLHKDTINELLGIVDGRTYDTEFGGISDADGYDPNFDNSSDIITVPNMPSIGVSNVGFVNVYNTTQGALQNLGSDLFPDFEEIPDVTPDTDTLTMLAHGFEYLGKNITTLLKSYINSNLVNYIIDCHCLPVTPTVGNTEKIKIGFKEFTQSASRVISDYVDFDCGALNIKEYYGNFIDYVGTRASLYLPFVGFVPIKNEYFQSGELRVKYRFNVVDGSFMCYVLATSSKSNLKDTVIGTYSGNACVHIPITGVNYSNMVSGVVNGAMGVGMSVATGNVGMAVGGALNMMTMRPQMQSSNSYNATSSFLGIRYPYLLIEREVSNFSELYPSEYGVPLNVTKVISELSGYVEMDENIHININCMDEEKTMITDLLTGGIII